MRIEEAEGRSNSVFKILLLHHETALRPRQTMSPYQKWVPNVYEILEERDPAACLQRSAAGLRASDLGCRCIRNWTGMRKVCHCSVFIIQTCRARIGRNIVTRWEDAGNLYRCFSCVINYHILWSVIASIGSYKTRLKHPILW